MKKKFTMKKHKTGGQAKKINLKKLMSYLLIFTVFFTTVQIGSIKKASAAAETQVIGMTFHIGSLSSTDTRVVDGNKEMGYKCEYLPMGKSFTFGADLGYTIKSVLLVSDSSGSEEVPVSERKMELQKQLVGTKDSYIINTITDYSKFYVKFVMIQDSAPAIETSYVVAMSFVSDSSLEFTSLRVTLDSQSPTLLSYSDFNGNTVPKINASASVKVAKIELLDSSGTSINCSVNGGSYSFSNSVNLVGGNNTINAKLTSQGISKQYNLIITKVGEAKLSSLVPSAGTLSPVFNKDTNNYTLTVPTTQSTIAFTPTAIDKSSTIKVDGVTINSGSKSQNIKLDEGDNEVEIVLTTKDGEKNTYSVAVTRTSLFRSAQLKSLTLTQGSLLPAFNKGVYEYTATVDNSVSSIGVIPTAEDANATITVNGKKIPSGATSPYINLDEGGNVINVKVTDSKGNSNTYVINVSRRYSKDNVNLGSLSVTDGTMSPKFDPENYIYSVKIAKNIEKVRVIFTLQNDKAKIKINGKEYTSGQQSDYIKLDIGANTVRVEITAEDGKTKTIYVLSIIRGDIKANNQWVAVAGNWTFYNGAGLQIKNQWVKYDNQWYFMDINGYMQYGWLSESGKWYYLNKDGIMQTGWFYDKGYWYYLQGNGAMNVNTWATYDGKWYLFNELGEVQTGWTFNGGRWYYMDEHGAQQKGWITYDKNKYYINDDGTMKNGWFYSGKSWCYLDDGGKMVRGWQTIDGKRYYFDANGIMKTGMMFLDGQWINLNNA